MVSIEWQNDAKAKTFATFALPPALQVWGGDMADILQCLQ